MSIYAVQAAYTPVAWAALLKNPHHRLEAIKPVVERLGGRIEAGWFTFGEYDLLIICELPDNVRAAALSMGISAGGAVKAIKTTPLMNFEDGLAALERAREAEYTPPRSEIPYFGVYRGET
ncbi:MAG: GYD domain-containing protein [Acetobacteraceae bacterium]|nr:GYD domain-containing protein [Acetobacteraceae bacterium]MBV8521992.1 GYD domain-containing protein [Acetobacteraceae bacterium]MBV8589386.1 GYD domain-containing protein [Acetobacteraceae bacterium]